MINLRRKLRAYPGRALAALLTLCVLFAALVPATASAETITRPTILETAIPVQVDGEPGTVVLDKITDNAPSPTDPASGRLALERGETGAFFFEIDGEGEIPLGDFYYSIEQSEKDRPGYDTTVYSAMIRVMYADEEAGIALAYPTIYIGDYNAVGEYPDIPDEIEGAKYDRADFLNLSSHDARSYGVKGETQSAWEFSPADPSADPQSRPEDTPYPFAYDNYKDPADPAAGTRQYPAQRDTSGAADPTDLGIARTRFTISFVDPYSMDRTGYTGADDPRHDGSVGSVLPPDVTEIDALDADGKVVGKYVLRTKADAECPDCLNAQDKIYVEFVPNPDFTGTPQPAVLHAVNAYHTPIRAIYQPMVLGPPTPTDAETTGPQGKTQNSSDSTRETELSFTKGSAMDGDFVKFELVDPATYKGKVGSDAGRDSGRVISGNSVTVYQNGKKIGVYTLVETIPQADGLTTLVRVTFTPEPDFVGDPPPLAVRVTDANGYQATAIYQPHVTAGPPVPPPPTPPTPEPPTPESPTPETPKPPLVQVLETLGLITPKTGDESRVGLWAALGGGALLALVQILIVLFRRKKRKEDE